MCLLYLELAAGMARPRHDLDECFVAFFVVAVVVVVIVVVIME